jgi:ketohexokinase
MAAVLGIGNATLDTIHFVDRYPDENDEVRCNRRMQRCGGNTANTLIVLSQLGMSSHWAGVLVENAEGRLVADMLVRHGVDVGASMWSGTGSMPVSSIMISGQTGSRTITHFRDLQEYGFAAFSEIDPGLFDWLHFEGRNVVEVRQMLKHLRTVSPGTRCSLEIEKPRDEIETLFPLADVLLFSRNYARSQGFTEPLALLKSVHTTCPEADLFCAWGEAGAAALGRDGTEYLHPAVRLARVVDTLGAGDTFNAGVISGYVETLGMEAILARACHLAGNKCGREGLDGLAEYPLKRRAQVNSAP